MAVSYLPDPMSGESRWIKIFQNHKDPMRNAPHGILGYAVISSEYFPDIYLGLDDAVEELSRMQEAENARREQDKLAGKTDEVKITKRQFRAG